MTVPMKSADFDRAYRAPITFWGDLRIPEELKALARQGSPGRRWSWGVASEGSRAIWHSRDCG